MPTPKPTTQPEAPSAFTPEQIRAVAPALSGYPDELIQAAINDLAARIRAGRLAKQQEGIRRKIESGQQYGAAPVGYINRRKGGITWLEKDPEVYPFVEEARTLYASGKYSIREICSVMNKKGLRSRNGKAIGPSSMWGILRKSDGF